MPRIDITTQTRAGARSWVALGVLTLSILLLAIDGTVLALAVPALTASLDPTATQLLWIGDIYSFALAGLLITMGNVADRIGRKRLLLIGATGFGLASLLAAFAPTAELLIAARVLLGISGATIMPSTLSLVRNIFPDPRQRSRAIAVWSAGATVGAAIGPLVGGALLESFWWGSVFLINVPVMVILVITGAILLPESRNPKPGRIDLLSAALSVVAIVPIVYAIKTFASDGFSWIAVGSVVLSVIGAVLFARRQRRLETPLIDLALFRIPAFSGAVAANTLAIFGFVGMLFFFSQYLQLVRGLSPLQAGLAELPSALASLAVIGIVSNVVARIGRGLAVGVGLAVCGAGSVLLAFAEGQSDLIWIILSLCVLAIGAGLAMTVSVDAVLSAVEKERSGAASAISETAYELGVALGIALLGSVLTAVYRVSLHLPESLTPTVAADVRESLGSAVHVAGDNPAVVDAAQEAFVVSIQTASFVAAAIMFVAAFIAARVIPAERTRSRSGH
ncbi:MAG TPA: MFS transporter [Pseudolysinimonas sp.]|nr:MFS transporter [Pseudolysinimonas sp.]